MAALAAVAVGAVGAALRREAGAVKEGDRHDADLLGLLLLSLLLGLLLAQLLLGDRLQPQELNHLLVGAEGLATGTVVVVVCGQALPPVAPAGDAEAQGTVPALCQGATCWGSAWWGRGRVKRGCAAETLPPALCVLCQQPARLTTGFDIG